MTTRTRGSDAGLPRKAFQKPGRTFPDAETPVKTTRALRGISSETSLRLCSRAPRMRTQSPSAPGSDLCLLSTCASIVVLFGPCGLLAIGPILGKPLLIVSVPQLPNPERRMASRSR
jgi:hypothetical protein